MKKIFNKLFYKLHFKKRPNKNTLRFFIPIIIICVLGIIAYANSLQSEFAVIDDYTTIVENPEIYNLSKHIRNADLQLILNSTLVNIFGITPFPFRVVSILMHLSVASLLYITVYLISKNKWISIVSAILFVIHPVTTEAVSWISAATYIHISLLFFATLIPLILFKEKQNKLYLYISLGIYIATIMLYRSPWIIITPIALIVIDQFILEKRFSFKSLIYTLLFFIPIFAFYITSLNTGYSNRVQGREGEYANKKLINQQALKPVSESYAYTTYTMFKQYAFPKDLVIYYDGNDISKNDLGPMYLVLFGYIGICIFAYRKNRPITGLLILLPVLVLPTYSPIKVTWYIAERYLYLGTGVFTILVATLLYKYVWLKSKITAYIIISILLILSVYKTHDRNKDWYNPITLANATISSAPLSVRPYNDLGYYYLSKGEYQESELFLNMALEVDPESGSAIHNLGYIYLNYGLPSLRTELTQNQTNFSNEEKQKLIKVNLESAKTFISSDDNQKALYLVNNALKVDPYSLDALAAAAEIYARTGNIDFALGIYNRMIMIDGETSDLLYVLSYMYFINEDYSDSLEALEKIKLIDPNYPNLDKSIENVKLRISL